MLLINQAKSQYVGNLELERKRHTAENIYSAIDELLAERILRIAAVVSDNAAVMIRFREHLCNQYPRVENLYCALHCLNMICKDLIKSRHLIADAQKVTTMLRYFHNSSHYKKVLLDWGNNNNVTRFLTKHIEIRWYSYVKMCL